jgi:predicted RNase H-like nuclease (RuvC/YqgF family)
VFYFHSIDDKDEIATQRNNLIRSRKAVNSQATEEASLSTAKGNKPSFARELFGNQVVSTELESSSTISSSKRPHPNDPMDKEKEELRAKVQKLQEQLKDAEELRAKVQKLEKELEDASHDVADKENEAINLKKELEMLRRKSPTPNDLSDSKKKLLLLNLKNISNKFLKGLYTNLGLVNGLITKLEDIVKSAEAPISKSTTITPPSTPAVTPSNTRRMVVENEIMLLICNTIKIF